MVCGRRAKDSVLKKYVLGAILVAMTKYLAGSSVREERLTVVQDVNRWARTSAQIGSCSRSLLAPRWPSKETGEILASSLHLVYLLSLFLPLPPFSTRQELDLGTKPSALLPFSVNTLVPFA